MYSGDVYKRQADILINGEEALVIKAAEGAAGAVEAIAQIWQVVELSLIHIS